MVQDGRKQEFSYFAWQSEPPDPQAEDTFMKSKLSWEDRDNAQIKLLAFYKELITFRKSRKACQGKTYDSVKVFIDERNPVIALWRTHDGDKIVIIFNFDNAVVPFHFPDEVDSRTKIFDSSAVQWGGNGELSSQKLKEDSVLLNPRSVIIFQ